MVTARRKPGAASPLVDANEMAQALGISKWSVYEGAKADTLPIPTLRIGKRSYRWSRAQLEKLLAGELEPRDAGGGGDDR